ncbi:hypothetical protein C6A77_12750 [Pseudomonas sp. AFG_SD02_1510_Pfu_092]|nr:hypothetical protein C6A77_12750 [Pseudomonas sp. AFG_SD02_1510_Pfu_092]
MLTGAGLFAGLPAPTGLEAGGEPVGAGKPAKRPAQKTHQFTAGTAAIRFPALAFSTLIATNFEVGV